LPLKPKAAFSAELRRRPVREQIVLIAVLWLALQVPLGSFIGECIRFGMAEHARWWLSARL